MNNKNMLTTGVIAVVVAALAFYGGMKYQQMHGATTRGGQFAGRGSGQFGQAGDSSGAAGQGNRGGAAFRPINGEITSSDDKSITVKLQDGSSKIVLFSDSTQINKADQASKDDLKSGTKVAVFGQTNADGSVTAQNIQLNPMMRAQMSAPPANQ